MLLKEKKKVNQLNNQLFWFTETGIEKLPPPDRKPAQQKRPHRNGASSWKANELSIATVRV